MFFDGSNLYQSDSGNDFESYLIDMLVVFIQSRQFDSAIKVISFLNKRNFKDKKLEFNKDVLMAIINLNTGQYKSCIDLSKKLLKKTKDKITSAYLLFIIYKSYTELDVLDKANKYFKAYIKKMDEPDNEPD